MTKLSPSLLAANPLFLQDEVQKAVKAGCDELHFDVMDAHFVKNLTFGPHILNALAKTIPMIYDVHLMLDDPYEMIAPFQKAGADIITVHQEAKDAKKCLQSIRALGCKAGISIKPNTSTESINPLLPLVDRVLLMTVEPGFGGQKLMTEVLHKAVELRNIGYHGEIQADGGITVENAPELVKRGVDVLVMGTAFFGAKDLAKVANTVHCL